MNIFQITKSKIIEILKDASLNSKIIIPENLDNISVDPAPSKFNSDLSTNVAMILSKINNKNPIILADEIKNLLIDKIKNIKDIKVEKPGFIN